MPSTTSVGTFSSSSRCSEGYCVSALEHLEGAGHAEAQVVRGGDGDHLPRLSPAVRGELTHRTSQRLIVDAAGGRHQHRALDALGVVVRELQDHRAAHRVADEARGARSRGHRGTVPRHARGRGCPGRCRPSRCGRTREGRAPGCGTRRRAARRSAADTGRTGRSRADASSPARPGVRRTRGRTHRRRRQSSSARRERMPGGAASSALDGGTRLSRRSWPSRTPSPRASAKHPPGRSQTVSGESTPARPRGADGSPALG